MRGRNRLQCAMGLVGALVLGGWILRPPTGLEARVFSTRSDRTFHDRWMKLQLDLDVRRVPRRGLSLGAFNRVVLSKDQGPGLELPEDLRLREIPLLVRGLERYAYGDDLPIFATSRTLAGVFEIALVVHRDQLRSGQWSFPWPRKVHESDLEAWLAVLADRQASAQAGQGTRLLATSLDRLREELPARFSDPEQQAHLRCFLEEVQADPANLDGMLVRELEEALPFAAFQAGAYRLAHQLGCFTREDYRTFRLHRKADRRDPAGLPGESQPLWAMLGMTRRKQELESARAEGNLQRVAVLEEKALRAVQEAVYRFPWSKEANDASLGAPAPILASKDLRCVGMAILLHTYLRHLGIAHEGLDLPNHVAILARTADGRAWVMDATADPYPQGTVVPLPQGKWVPAHALGYPGHGCRLPAERLLAASVLWNQGLRLKRDSKGSWGSGWRHRFPAWLPANLHAIRAGYAAQMDPREASLWLEWLRAATPDDPAVFLDQWALEQDRGRAAEARTAWEQVIALSAR